VTQWSADAHMALPLLLLPPPAPPANDTTPVPSVSGLAAQ